jgi:hypothetical protein
VRKSACRDLCGGCRVTWTNSFDDEEDKFIDVIHLPQTAETKTKSIESQLIQRTGDKFRWIAEDASLNPVGTINTFDCERSHGTFKYAVAVGKHLEEMDLQQK